MSYGYVYVLANESLQYLKVGQTTRSPESRARELSSTGVPTPFKVAYKVYVENCEKMEKDVHRMLHKYRVHENREFFEVDLTMVVGVIEMLCEPLPMEYEDESLDPLDCMKSLAEERVVNEKESRLREEIAIVEARNFLYSTFELLKTLNGRYNAIGNSIHFYSEEGEDYICINMTEAIDELPGNFMRGGPDDQACVVYYRKSDGALSVMANEYFNDVDTFRSLSDYGKSPLQLAKDIIRIFSWATDDDARDRANPTMLFKDMLQAVWDEAVDKRRYYFHVDDRYARHPNYKVTIEEYFKELEWLSHFESVAKKLYKLGAITAIVRDSWASVSMARIYNDEYPCDEASRNIILSINCTIPEELTEIEATIDRVESECVIATTKYDLTFSMHTRADLSGYIGRKVILNTDLENPIVGLV